MLGIDSRSFTLSLGHDPPWIVAKTEGPGWTSFDRAGRNLTCLMTAAVQATGAQSFEWRHWYVAESDQLIDTGTLALYR
jgi:hypothetical protein